LESSDLITVDDSQVRGNVHNLALSLGFHLYVGMDPTVAQHNLYYIRRKEYNSPIVFEGTIAQVAEYLSRYYNLKAFL